MGTEYFSRFAPFRGLIFKSADSNKPPANVFSKLDMQDNLDGEGILWQAQRISERSERTKIMIVLSDGFPAAKYSHEGELQRHLYMVTKWLEANKDKGLHLWGLGCKSDRVKDFFENADVLNDVDDLPKAALRAVEYILVRIVGSMG
jgi:cobaltochelatase CobT